MNDSWFISFLAHTTLAIMMIGLAVTITALCTMLVRSVYRDWNKL